MRYKASAFCCLQFVTLLWCCSTVRLKLRTVEHIYKATAPTTLNSGTSTYGPRRVIGSQDIDGKGTKHDFESCDPFLYFDDSLLPRGNPSASSFNSFTDLSVPFGRTPLDVQADDAFPSRSLQAACRRWAATPTPVRFPPICPVRPSLLLRTIFHLPSHTLPNDDPSSPTPADRVGVMWARLRLGRRRSPLLLPEGGGAGLLSLTVPLEGDHVLPWDNIAEPRPPLQARPRPAHLHHRPEPPFRKE